MNRRKGRAIHGILLLNKPIGMTSNAVLQAIKRLFFAQKAGHTGSLDPIATGMLPICFGEATKFCQYLLEADKCYEVTGFLGVKTTTGDATGEPVAVKEVFPITEPTLRATLEQFVGSIKQRPSMFSALKHRGQPLYKYARAGIEIERMPREIKIYSLQLLSFNGKEITLKVQCSKGTYIRNLIEDIGERLGVGAHVTRLHRIYTTGFENEPMYTPAMLENKSLEWLDAKLLPMDYAVASLPRLVLEESWARLLQQGLVIKEVEAGNITGCVRLYTGGDQFLGLGELDGHKCLKAKRLLSSYSS